MATQKRLGGKMKPVLGIFVGMIFLVLGFKPSYGAALCGRQGTIEERIRSCQAVHGERAWRRVRGQDARIYSWRMVSATRAGTLLWRDEATLLLWTDVHTQRQNWQAAIDLCIERCEAGKSCSSAQMKAGLIDRDFWLPTLEDYQLAVEHGYDRIIRRKDLFWTSSRRDSTRAFYYDAIHGNMNSSRGRQYFDHSSIQAHLAVRCVGQ